MNLRVGTAIINIAICKYRNCNESLDILCIKILSIRNQLGYLSLIQRTWPSYWQWWQHSSSTIQDFASDHCCLVAGWWKEHFVEVWNRHSQPLDQGSELTVVVRCFLRLLQLPNEGNFWVNERGQRLIVHRLKVNIVESSYSALADHVNNGLAAHISHDNHVFLLARFPSRYSLCSSARDRLGGVDKFFWWSTVFLPIDTRKALEMIITVYYNRN